jgi:hypothetical protein
LTEGNARGKRRIVSLSLLQKGTAEAPPGLLRSLAGSASWRRFASFAPRLLPRALDALALAWIAVFHHILGLTYRFAQIAYDEHFFLTEGWSVVKGQVPYRDFQEFKPPVIFFVNALGLELFGLKGLGYRKFLAILSLSSFLAVAIALLSRRVNRLLVIGVLMLMVNHFYDDVLHNHVINDAETLALDFFLLGTGVLLIRTQWVRTQQILGGALLALSPLSKEPVVFASFAAWLSLLLLHRIEAGRERAARKFAFFTISGIASVGVIWLIYMLVTRSLGWYFLELKLSFAYTRNYAYQLHWASRTPPGGVLIDSLRHLEQVYLDAQHFVAFIPFFVALVALAGRRWMVSVGGLIAFVAGLYAVTIGHGFAARYFIMGMTGTLFCVVLGALELDAASKRSGSEMSRWVGATWLAIALALTLPRFCTEWEKRRSYRVEPSPVAQSDIDMVHAYTTPNDTIWTTDDPLLYVYSDRVSAFRGGMVLDEIIDYFPGKTDKERLSVIRQGLVENRPKLVVFGDDMVGPHRKRRYMQALVWPFLNDGGYVRLNDRFYVRPD